MKWNMFQTSGILAISYKFVFLCQWRNVLVQTVLSCLPYSKPLLTIYKALLHHIQSSLFNISSPPSFYHIQSPLFTTYRAHSSQIWRSSLQNSLFTTYRAPSLPYSELLLTIYKASPYHISRLPLLPIATAPHHIQNFLFTIYGASSSHIQSSLLMISRPPSSNIQSSLSL